MEMLYSTRASTDRELALAWSQGDESAFAALVDRHSQTIRCICRRELGELEADDATQTVFMIVHRRADQLALAQKPSAWIHGVTRNVIRNARRSQRRRQRAEENLKHKQLTEQDQTKAACPELDTALESLPEHERIAIRMFYFGGHSQAEIAQAEGCAIGTIKARIHRGIKRLRGEMRQRGVYLSAGALLALLHNEGGAAESVSHASCSSLQSSPAQLDQLLVGKLISSPLMVPVACVVSLVLTGAAVQQPWDISEQQPSQVAVQTNEVQVVLPPDPEQDLPKQNPGSAFTNPPQKGNGRWQQHSRRAAEGQDKFITTAATFFGTASHEEFVAAATLPSGDIVAAGNAWGPDFPAMRPVKTLGKGQWYDVSAYKNGEAIIKDRRGKERAAPLAPYYPNTAGFLVVFSPDLQEVKRLIKFDWGVATISDIRVLPDGDLIIAGQAQQALQDSLLRSLPAMQRHHYPMPSLEVGNRFAHVEDARKRQEREAKWRRQQRNRFGPLSYEGIQQSGDAYVLRLSDFDLIRWAVTLEGHRQLASPLTYSPQGWVAFSANGPKRVDIDTGKPDLNYAVDVRKDALAIDPHSGSFYQGGDRNTHTGREPWRQPFLHRHEPGGERSWSGYNWHPHTVGHDRLRLVSDSSVRFVIPDSEGYLWVAMWSDGGNTVATRAPWDLMTGPRQQNPLGMSSWGAEVGGFTHFVRWHPERLDFAAYSFWAAYMPRTGQPNSAGVSAMGVLADNSLIIRGKAASCLVQTPHAWVSWPAEIWDQSWQEANHGFGYGGEYVTVFNKDLNSIRFSSYLPGMTCKNWADAPDGGIILIGAAFGPADHRHDAAQGGPNPVPVRQAIQPEFAGGHMDAHIILMHDPKEETGK